MKRFHIAVHVVQVIFNEKEEDEWLTKHESNCLERFLEDNEGRFEACGGIEKTRCDVLDSIEECEVIYFFPDEVKA